MPNDTFKQLTQLPSYMRLWFARLSGAMGSQMLMVAVGWLARAMVFGSGGNQAAVVAGPALGGLIFVAGATAVYWLVPCYFC